MDTFEPHTFGARDGYPLAGRLFRPPDRTVAAALIVPAMGVAQPYYAAFAGWLARQGVLAATFDYRGIGLSRRGSLRDLDANVLTWARLDVPAALDALAQAAAGAPLVWIGHSLGGQIVPFVPEASRVVRILNVAAGTGYWRENTASARRLVWLMWFAAVPLLTPLFGYFPGRRLRMVGDLPRGVIYQWRRWCLHPGYAAGLERAQAAYAGVRAPIVSLSFTDDEFMSARNIESLQALYRGAPLTPVRLAPRALGVARIGHFGFFRVPFEDTLWVPYVLPVVRDAAAAGAAAPGAERHREHR